MPALLGPNIMPKFGQVTPTQVWAAATRTLTDFSAEEIFDLPIFDSQYPGATCSSGASADAYGDWVELVADVGTGKRLLFVNILPRMVDASYAFEFEFGEGTAGNEVAIARVNGRGNFLSTAGWVPGALYPVWKSLTNSARLSMRAKDNIAAARDFNVTPMIA